MNNFFFKLLKIELTYFLVNDLRDMVPVSVVTDALHVELDAFLRIAVDAAGFRDEVGRSSEEDVGADLL